jgi:protein-S-isoprenylcysteine O-methyltransferase Ste14
MFSGVREFKKLQTTVNPLDPAAATTLATSGVFGFTRNPMYLGMSSILLAFCIYHGAWLGLPLIILFMVYITLFQIHPEEKAMQDLFGDAFEDYKAKVRRWL